MVNLPNLALINHPLLQHKLGLMRDKNTRPPEFRRLMEEIAFLMAYEAIRDFSHVNREVETPFGKSYVASMEDRPVVVSIMRAGNGMMRGVLDCIPFASAGHIGIYRDKFLNSTVEYYFRLPEKIEGKRVLVVDPLLATGDTALATIERIKQYGVKEVRMLTICASVVGLTRMAEFHPDVKIFAVSLEEKMDANGFLIPGIGDAGSRLYGTGE